MPDGKVYTGPFSKDFERHFLEHLEKKTKENPLRSTVCLVSSNYLAMYLRYALLDRLGSQAGIEFLTFIDLAKKLSLGPLIESGREELPTDIEELMIEDLCESLTRQSKYYDVRNLSGFHRALRRSFHDLIDGGCLNIPSEFDSLQELGHLLDQHRSNYSTRFYTNADLVLESHEHTSLFREVFGAEELSVYGFYDLTFTQSLLLESLSKVIPVSFWIPSHSQSPSGNIPTHLLEKCESWGFSKEVVSKPATGETRCLSSATSHTEPTDIVTWLLEHRPENAAILLRDFDDNRERYQAPLQRAGLPHYIEGGTSAIYHPQVQASLRVLDLLESEWSRSEILDFLRSFPWPEELVNSCGSPADWDLWSRKANITRSLPAFEKGMRNFLKRHPSDKLGNFVKRVLPFLSHVSQLKTVSTWKDHVFELRSLFLTWLPEEDLLPELKSVWADVETLDRFRAPTSFSQISNLFRGRLQKIRIKERSFLQDAIFLGRLESARGLRFDTIILPHMVEGFFPGTIRNDPLLSDVQRDKLNRKYGCDLSLRNQRPEEEAFLFRLLQSSAKTLLLSSPRRELLGAREFFPSIFYKEALVDQNLDTRPTLPWTRPTKVPLDHYELYRNHWARWVLDHPGVSSTELSKAIPMSEPMENLILERFLSRSLTPYDGILTEIAKGEEKLATSVSAIQDYLECPYRFLLKHRLGLRPYDAPDEVEDLSPLDRGSIVHDVLHRFFTQAKKQKLLPLQEEARKELSQILNEEIEGVFSEARTKYALGYESLWKAEKTFIRNDLWQLVERELTQFSPFIPEAFEVGFGTEVGPGESGMKERLEYPLGRASLLFKGRLDRIDISSEGQRARVIDYKTGKQSKVKDNAFRGGKDLQLPIYLLALQAMMPRFELHAITGHLVFTSSMSSLREKVFEGSVLDAKKRDLHRILQVFYDGVRHGHYPARPEADRKNCRFCDFHDLCGGSVHRTFVRKENDAKFQPLKDLEDIE